MAETGQLAPLIGKTLSAIEGAENGSERITFHCEDGTVFLMHHFQDCCESVAVEDVCGDVADLFGSPICIASEDTNEDDNDWGGSLTWTFYNIATAKGHVTIRWYGESNGYYSEAVDFVQTNEEPTNG